MTQTQMSDCLTILAANFNKIMDSTLTKLWWETFNKFDGDVFEMACRKLLTDEERPQYFPHIAEINKEYRNVFNFLEQKKFDALKQKSRLLAENQDFCFLCENKGFVLFTKYVEYCGVYETMARCICCHGKDLNHYSKPQIDKDFFPKEGEINNSYILDIQEALGDAFCFFEVEKKQKYIERQEVINAPTFNITKIAEKMKVCWDVWDVNVKII